MLLDTNATLKAQRDVVYAGFNRLLFTKRNARSVTPIVYTKKNNGMKSLAI